MKQTLTNEGQVVFDLLNINLELQEDRDKFAYIYLALDYDIRKLIEKAFYKALSQQLVERKEDIIVQKSGSINYIRVHVNDIMDSLHIIKHYIQPRKEEHET